jgi:endonuclease/exonuclease/phosphatase family metal-dependent hydrolase
MKLITLNTWGGRAGKDRILKFFEQYKKDADVFCLQEIWSAPYGHLEGSSAGGVPINNNGIMTRGMQEISALCGAHIPYFRPHHGDHYGLMMLVKNNLEIVAEGEIFVYKEKGYVPVGDVGNHARNIQYVTFLCNQKPLTILNFHGLWNGKGKTDTEDRIIQSKNILNFITSLQGEIILAGDFNLLPETQSLKIIEEANLKNLIKEYGVKSTRTSFYTKPERFADYILVSPGVEVKDFKVLPEEVSDHSALYLEF